MKPVQTRLLWSKALSCTGTAVHPARVWGCSLGVHDRGERCASDFVATVLALTPVLLAFQIFDEETRTKITQICVAPLPPSQKVFPASWTLGVEEPLWIVGRFHVSHKIEYDKAEQVRHAL